MISLSGRMNIARVNIGFFTGFKKIKQRRISFILGYLRMILWKISTAISIKHRILATFNKKKKKSILTACMPLMFRTVGYISEGCIFFNHAKRRLRMLLSNIIPTFRLLFVCARISINFDCFYMEMYAFNTFCLHTSPCYNVMLGKSMFFHHERLLQRI